MAFYCWQQYYSYFLLHRCALHLLVCEYVFIGDAIFSLLFTYRSAKAVSSAKTKYEHRPVTDYRDTQDSNGGYAANPPSYSHGKQLAASFWGAAFLGLSCIWIFLSTLQHWSSPSTLSSAPPETLHQEQTSWVRSMKTTETECESFNACPHSVAHVHWGLCMSAWW